MDNFTPIPPIALLVFEGQMATTSGPAKFQVRSATADTQLQCTS